MDTQIPAWALAAALNCGQPVVHYDTLLVFGEQESGLRQFVVHDNVTGRVKDHPTAASALKTARQWLADGGNIDAGWTQINFRGESRDGMPLASAFDACAAAKKSASILADGWEMCSSYRPLKARMDCAARVYNSGRTTAGYSYASRLWKTASQIVPSIGRIMTQGFTEAAPITGDGARRNIEGTDDEPNVCAAPAWDTWGRAACTSPAQETTREKDH